MPSRRERLGSDLRKVDVHVIQPHEYDDAPELTDNQIASAIVVRKQRSLSKHEAAEDAADLRIIREARAAMAAGRDVLPPEASVISGKNPVRVVREWRDMRQGALAAAVGISRATCPRSNLVTATARRIFILGPQARLAGRLTF